MEGELDRGKDNLNSNNSKEFAKKIDVPNDSGEKGVRLKRPDMDERLNLDQDSFDLKEFGKNPVTVEAALESGEITKMEVGLPRPQIDEAPQISELKTTEGIPEIRDWLNLPTDITRLIFNKAGLLHIFFGCQWVCSDWRKISKQSEFYSSLDFTNSDFMRYLKRNQVSIPKFFKECWTRCGTNLIELSVDDNVASNDLFLNDLKKFSLLKVLRVPCCSGVTVDGLITLLYNCPVLEELHVCPCLMCEGEETEELLEVVGTLHLDTFRLYCSGTARLTGRVQVESCASLIAKNLHQIRNIVLRGMIFSREDLYLIVRECRCLLRIDLGDNFTIKLGKDNVHQMLEKYLLQQAEEEEEEEEEDGWMQDYETGCYLPRKWNY